MPAQSSQPHDNEEDDASLLRRYAHQGDVAAMDALILRHASSLRAFLAGWTSSPTTLEDLFQETWMRVLQKPNRFHRGNFRAWLLCIARNLVIDEFRRHRPDLLLDAPVSSSDPDSAPLIQSLPDETAVLPSELLARHDLHHLLRQAIHTLPAPQRDVFLLRAEDIPFHEIATHLHIPLNTALGRMHYALKNLRHALRPFFPKEPPRHG